MLMIGALAVLAQAAAPETAAEGRRARPECVAIRITSPQQTETKGGRGPFSATQILDIRFGTILRREFPGPHVLGLRLVTPRGHLYQTLTVPFTASGQSRGERLVDGYPRPMREQETRPVSDEGSAAFELVATLPVGGTAITTNSLYGEWRVEPLLDGAPCGNAAPFQINP
jgi:hypothetical protein